MRNLLAALLLALSACGTRHEANDASAPDAAESRPGAPVAPRAPPPPVAVEDAGPLKPHAPVLPDSRVLDCTRSATGKASLMSCLERLSVAAPPPDGGPRKFRGERPPVINPAWSVPAWHFDPAGRVAACSDDNTCVDSAHPCCTFREIVARWGTDTPVLRQNTTFTQHSSHAVNPAVDQIRFTPRVQNAAQVTFQCDFVQACTGTVSNVVQLSRAYPDVATSATLCAGLTQPTMLHVLHGGVTCDAWIDTNTSGTTWSLTHLLDGTGSDQLCGITNGDSYTAVVPVTSNVRYWDPYWEDLADNPDSRPQLLGCNLGVGTDTGAGTDTAQTFVGVNGSIVNEASFNSSTMVQQARFTHGSRAYGQLQNAFFSDSSARTTVTALGPSVPTVGATANPIKLIDINGGRLFGPILHNVQLRGDVRIMPGGGTASGSGTIVYRNAYAPNFTVSQGYLVPNSSSGGILYGAGGQLSLSGASTFICASPAATNCPLPGLLLDGTFDGYALDDSVQPAQTRVHVSLLGSTLWQAMDGTIASGGCGGHCVGRAGSVATFLNAVPTTPGQWLNAGANVTLTQNSPGPGQVTIASTSAGGVTSVSGTGGTSCSPTTGAVSCSSASVPACGQYQVIEHDNASGYQCGPAPGPSGNSLNSNGTSWVSGLLPAGGVAPGNNATALFSDGTGCPSGSPCVSEWDTISGDLTFDHFSAGGAFYHVVGINGVPESTTGSLTNGDVLTYSSTGPKWTNKQPSLKLYANVSGATFNIGTSLSSCVTVPSVVVASGQNAYVTAMAWVLTTDGSVLHIVRMNITNVTNSGTGQVGQVDLGVPTGGPSGTNGDATLSGMNIDNSVGTFTYATQLSRTGTLGPGQVQAAWCSIQAIVQ